MTNKDIGPPEEDRNTDALFEEVYQELRRIAGNIMRRERGDHTLQPTAVVHEAYLKLSAQNGENWTDRKQFLSIAAMSIRRILVDHARRRDAVKRGGRRGRITLSGLEDLTAREIELPRIDEALERLTALDARQGRVVELRFFGGLSVAEAADVLGVSKRTAEGDWAMARAWLHRELCG